MPEVIEGQGIPVLEQTNVAVEGSRIYDDREIAFGHEQMDSGLFEKIAAYTSLYKDKNRADRISALEESMQEIRDYRGVLTKEQQKSLGYLTTIYAFELFYQEGRVEIPDVGFLDERDLLGINFVLAGAYNFDFGDVYFSADNALEGMSGCQFRKLIVAGTDFGYKAVGVRVEEMVVDTRGLSSTTASAFVKSAGCRVEKLSGHLYRFGEESDSLQIQELRGSGLDIGNKATALLIADAFGNFPGLLRESSQSKIVQLNTDSDLIGENSSDLEIEHVIKVGSNFAKGSKDLQVGTADTLGPQAACESTSAVLDTLGEVGNAFGSESSGLQVNKVTKAGHMFGKKSTGLTAGRIEEVGCSFGSQSVDLKVEYIGVADVGFGRGSKGLRVRKVKTAKGVGEPLSEDVELDGGYLSNSENAFVVECGTTPLRSSLHGKGNFSGFPDGRYLTELDLKTVSETLKNDFGIDFLSEAAELL